MVNFSVQVVDWENMGTKFDFLFAIEKIYSFDTIKEI